MRLLLHVRLIAGAFPDVLFQSVPRKSEIATGLEQSGGRKE